MKKPAFEIISSDSLHVKIYEDGRVEGWPKDKECCVINRIPLLITDAKNSSKISNNGVDSQY